ncbi:hypothetical protein SZ25_00434 [Candidatus Arcanobacter lacustris]|uniref:Uncharacterized protein n=1 Tax=Candidatus Arcanibacter lacustris TaxID=1607817 RepID=A0A0F5MNR9_9RICK|nr:hypothetical protein SZ25_00434 [Candidatus Arcanobacter lacustris]
MLIVFASPEEDMPKDFDERVDYYYDLLKLSKSGTEFTNKLKEDLFTSLEKLNGNIMDNLFVKITGDRKKSRIKITPHVRGEEPLHFQ